MRLEIFKPGRHSGELTADALARSAAVYDPKIHEAPLVIGHPKHNAPAHGWVGKFRRGRDGR